MSLLLPLLALAAAASDPCETQRNQSELTMCAYQMYDTADEAMNAQWTITAEYMRNLDTQDTYRTDDRPGYFRVLLTGQRAWLKFRDAQCQMEGYWARGGSMEPMLVGSCLANLTDERTKQLQDLAESLN